MTNTEFCLPRSIIFPPASMFSSLSSQQPESNAIRSCPFPPLNLSFIPHRPQENPNAECIGLFMVSSPLSHHTCWAPALLNYTEFLLPLCLCTRCPAWYTAPTFFIRLLPRVLQDSAWLFASWKPSPSPSLIAEFLSYKVSISLVH